MRARSLKNLDLHVSGMRASFWVLLLAAVADGQFYGRSLPCPTSYLDPDGDCVTGIAGKDYPLHSTFPKTPFKCSDHPVKLLGYFADPVSSCQVFHVCLHDGRQESFLCPNGTLFNQQFLVCDWWFNVKCNDAYTFYQINDYLQAPIKFRPGPVHPNSIPASSNSNLTPNRKSDNVEQAIDTVDNNNLDSSPNLQLNPATYSVRKGAVENFPMDSQVNYYDIMPRRPANRPEEIQTTTTTTTTTTEAPITPSSIEWAMFGLKERKDDFGGALNVRISTVPAGKPRMV